MEKTHRVDLESSQASSPESESVEKKAIIKSGGAFCLQ